MDKYVIIREQIAEHATRSGGPAEFFSRYLNTFYSCQARQLTEKWEIEVWEELESLLLSMFDRLIENNIDHGSQMMNHIVKHFANTGHPVTRKIAEDIAKIHQEKAMKQVAMRKEDSSDTILRQEEADIILKYGWSLIRELVPTARKEDFFNEVKPLEMRKRTTEMRKD